MADGQHGGYRRPANPAPVSGPGSLSRRTDGGPAAKRAPIQNLPDAGYGEQAEFRSIQQGAPIQKVAAPDAGAPGGAPAQGPLPPALDAPTGRHDEPVTAGVDMGDGPGSDVLGLGDPTSWAQDDIRYMKRYLPTLQYMVDSTPHANPATRALVRYLRSMSG
jgi:hypothetical protein